MFSSCLCSGSRSDLSWEYLGLSIPVIPCAAVTLLPSPFVWAMPHSWPVQPCAHLSQSCLWGGWWCCSPSPSPVCSPGPSVPLRALQCFRVHFQAGTKMGHGATRIWAPPRRSVWIKYSSRTGCSCSEPKILTVQGREMSAVTQFYLAFRLVCCICS